MFIDYDNISSSDLRRINTARLSQTRLVNPALDDITSFESLLNNNQTPRSFSSGGGFSSGRSLSPGRDFSSEVKRNNDELIRISEEANESIRNASAEAIAQRVIDQKNAMQLSSSASAVKKATEAIEKIKF